MAGGKGVNVARALKTLGQPVIATGVAGGPTGTRIIEQLTEEAILNDFVRIREESRTSTAVVDPTSGEQTEINERGPDGLRGRARAVRGQAALPRQGRGACASSPAACRAASPTTLYARPGRASCNRLGVTTVLDSEGEPLRLATRAEPDVVTPNELEAEELVGHEFADDEDRAAALARDRRAGRARGDHDACRTAAWRSSARRGERRLYRRHARPGRRGAALARRLGRRLPRRLRRVALQRQPAGGLPALRRGLRRRVRRSTSGPACSTRARSSGCSTRWTVEQLAEPALGRRAPEPAPGGSPQIADSALRNGGVRTAANVVLSVRRRT